ncbi:MAG: hypothetical protein QNJ30_17725 [Kiloniellales bacterium]|nr:hypothetical protein [Kiloniellales bacterium]
MTPLHGKSADEFVTLTAKVAFLRRPDSYPDRPKSVKAVETHMSWVFLTDDHAYKLKKPVRYDFLDFSSIEARRLDCQEEVRLNRRLAPDVYLGTLPIRAHPDGRLSLEGKGAIVDWLVKMRRLPRELMLDQAVRESRVRDEDADRVASVLAQFYRTSACQELTPKEYRDRFLMDIRANLDALSKPSFGLCVSLIDRVGQAQLRLLERRPELLKERVRQRRIVEAHGDLRPEHICLGPSPMIIDCLEFNRDFRILDPVDELCFLAMECELLGAAFVGRRIFETYRGLTGDDPTKTLVAFYKCYRACLRAKLAVWHLADPETCDPERWAALARDYLALADGYAGELTP